MVGTNLCPRCHKRYRGESHLCAPSALEKRRKLSPPQAQRR